LQKKKCLCYDCERRSYNVSFVVRTLEQKKRKKNTNERLDVVDRGENKNRGHSEIGENVPDIKMKERSKGKKKAISSCVCSVISE
jgi:hypothetical protein